MVIIMIMVMVVVSATVRIAGTIVTVDPGARKIQATLRFVLVLRQHVGANKRRFSRFPPQWKLPASSVLPLPL